MLPEVLLSGVSLLVAGNNRRAAAPRDGPAGAAPGNSPFPPADRSPGRVFAARIAGQGPESAGPFGEPGAGASSLN